MYRTIAISGVSEVNINESFFALNVESVADPKHIVNQAKKGYTRLKKKTHNIVCVGHH